MSWGSRIVQATALLTGVIAAGFGALSLALNLIPRAQYTRVSTAVFASFISYGVMFWLIAAALFVVAGRRSWVRFLAIPCLVALVIQASWLAPYLPGAAPTASGSSLRVLSINLNFGKADPEQLAEQVRRERPDVVILVEVQQPVVDALTEQGVTGDYPYAIGNVPPGWAATGRESDEGTVIWSRTPLHDVEKLPTPNGQYVVSVERPDGPVTVMAVRPRNVLLGMTGWRTDSAAVAEATRAHLDEPLVLAGDFNAVPEHVTLRTLTDLGLHSAARQAGVGWSPTYPSNDEHLPPLIEIDHVLINGRVTATGFRSFPIYGTDHRGLVADLVIVR